MVMLVTYKSNNSGGGWWLDDKDWKALEKAGWHVIWGHYYFCGGKGTTWEAPPGKEQPCLTESSNPGKVEKTCPGHRKFDTAKEASKSRYMGALAVAAQKEFKSIGEAKREFMGVTGKDTEDNGCPCCGAPHDFFGG